MEPAGEALAKARHAQLLELVPQDPERALSLALPFRLRREMPMTVTRWLEERVSGWGRLEAVMSSRVRGGVAEEDATYRVTMSNRVYRAFIYGRHVKRPQRQAVALHGIALAPEPRNPGNQILALAEAPLRILEQEETAARLGMDSTVATARAGGACYAELAGQLIAMASPAQAQALNEQLIQADSTSPALMPPRAPAAIESATNLPPPSWGTQGAKRLLLVPVTFADDPRPPQNGDSVESTARANNQFMVNNSYGIMSVSTAVTPVYGLPQRKYFYGEFLGQLFGDAMRLAAADGYNLSEYDFVYTIFPSIPGIEFGGRSDGLLVGGAGAISHEMGHNLGLGHASFWDTRGNLPLPEQPKAPQPPYPFDEGSLTGHEDINAPWIFYKDEERPIEIYGNIYDNMGSSGGHFSAAFKFAINWLPSDFIRVVTTSATNRLYPFDTTISPGRIYALVVPKDSLNTYWITHREGFPNNPWAVNGVELQWDGLLLDTTPGSLPGKQDAGVVVGRTFYDPQRLLYVTPIAKGGGPSLSDRWIDVVVQFGPFPTNRPPTLSMVKSDLYVESGATVSFTAEGTDPDGDQLAWHWQFGDDTFGSNAPEQAHTFANEGQYPVLCEVSDMKGGVVSATRLVVVGSPSTRLMSGHVFDPEGRPVRGAKVHNCGDVPSTYRVGWTDSEGFYAIGNIPPGTYINRAFIYGYRTDPVSFFDPIVLTGGNATNLDHMAVPLPHVSVRRVENASEAGDAGQFEIKRTGDVSKDLEVQFALSGTAAPGVNYTSIDGNVVVIPAGAESTIMQIEPIHDPAGDGPKSVVIELSHCTNDMRITSVLTNVVSTNGSTLITNSEFVLRTNWVSIPGWELRRMGADDLLYWFQTYPRYVMEPSSAELTIVDADPPDTPQVGVYTIDPVATELNNDAGSVLFTRTGGSIESPLAVRYSITGTAGGDDYLALPGWVTIPAGSRGVVLPVHAAGDLYVESTETLAVTVEAEEDYLAQPGSALIMVLDAGLPVVSAYALDSIADKAGGNAGRVTLSRSGDLSRELVVRYIAAGSAIPGEDYVPLTGTATIPAGQITVDVQVVPIPKPGEPGFKTVEVVVSDSPVYNIHPQHSATVTLRPRLPVLTVAANPDTMNEGGAASFVISVSGTNLNTNSLVVHYATGGFGTDQYDYGALGQTVVIPAGASSVSVPVTGYNDKYWEVGALIANESAILQLLPSTNYLVGSPASAQVTISDDDGSALPAIEFMGERTFVREDEGGVSLPVRITANPRTNQQPAIIEYRITGGSAVAGVNYDPLPDGYGLVSYMHVKDPPIEVSTMVKNELSIKRIPIAIHNDGVAAGDRTIVVQLFYHQDYITNYVGFTNSMGEWLTNVLLRPTPTNAYIGFYRSHTITIVDVGTTVVSVEPGTSLAFEGGAPGAFTFRRSGGDTNHELTIRYATTGTAAADTDYIRLPGTVTFPPGAEEVTVPLTAVDDVVEEWVETVTVTVLKDRGFTTGGNGASVSIMDNDGTLQFSQRLYTASESAGVVPVTVVRTGNTNNPVSVNFAVFDGTALRGEDYLATNGTLRFAAGESFRTIGVNMLPDTIVEPDETLTLVLSNATGGLPVGGQDTATLVIVNDDTDVGFADVAFPANENGTNALIEVWRSGVTNTAVSVQLATEDDSATDRVDYVGTNVVVQFAPGETNRVVKVRVLDDALFEGDELANLYLSQPNGALLGAISNATLVVVDDECAIGFAEPSSDVPEYAGTASLLVRRYGGSANSVKVNFSTADGTAQSGADYIPTAGSLIFAGEYWTETTNGSGGLEFHPGETEKTIEVRILDDALGENTEQFSVRLASPSVLSPGARPGSVIVGSTNLPSGTNTLGGSATTLANVIDDELPGQVDSRFDPGIGPDGPVYALALQPGGKVAIGGEFLTVDGFFVPHLARLQPDGYLDFTFNPGQPDGPVYALATAADGKVAVAGDFATIGGVTRNRIALLNADGTVDLSFDPLLGANAPVRAVAVYPGNRLLVGGEFTSINGLTRNRLARLGTNGLPESSFSVSFNNAVLAIAVQPDGRILVGGAFTSAGGVPRNGFARLNSNGTVDTNFIPGLGANDDVHAMALQSDGQLLLGGIFTSLGGRPSRSIGRVQTNATVDTSFVIGPGANALVTSIGVDSSGRILAGGDFTSLVNVSRSRIARLFPDGHVDPTFDPGSGADAIVRALVVQPDSAIVIGGDFTQVDGLPRAHVARLHGNDQWAGTDDTPVHFVSLTRTTNQVSLLLNGGVGQSCVIEVSDTLSPPAWVRLTGAFFNQTNITVLDRTVLGVTQRFYRAKGGQ